MLKGAYIALKNQLDMLLAYHIRVGHLNWITGFMEGFARSV